MANGDTKTEAMLNVLGNGGSGDEFRGCCNTKTQQYILDAIDRVQSVEDEVEEIKNNPDVADIVATYSDLQAYDKSKLTDKDVIRVLADETHNGDSTYYRYSKSSNDFTYIGESKQYVNFVGTDGTAAGVAGLVPGPATTDAGKFLKADGTWDTVGGGGSEFVDLTVTALGTDAITVTANKTPTEVGALVSAGKDVVYRLVLAQTVPGFAAGTYLLQTVMAGSTGVIASALATPDTISTRGYIFGQGINQATGTIYVKNLDAPAVVQATGTSTTDVMSQNAVSSMVFADPGTDMKIEIGAGADASQSNRTVAIGADAGARNTGAVALGWAAYAPGIGQIALGAASGTNDTTQGVMNIGPTNEYYGYNNTKYRLLTGVHDGQGDHDAVTLGQLNGRVKQNAGAPTTSTVGTVGQLLEDTTNGKLYQCTAVDTTDPNNPSYTWTEIGAGGGGGGDTVYSDKTTSNSTTGGAVYIGNLNANQEEQPDPTAVDSHRKYFWALPYINEALPQGGSVNILGQEAGEASVAIGSNAICRLGSQTAIGASALNNYSATRGTALGYGAQCLSAYAVALGSNAETSRGGEVNVGTGTTSNGYNGTSYRVIGGVHDGQLAQDAVTVNQVNSVIDAINTALSTNIPHIGA